MKHAILVALSRHKQQHNIKFPDRKWIKLNSGHALELVKNIMKLFRYLNTQHHLENRT